MWVYDNLYRTLYVHRIFLVIGALLWTGCADDPSQENGRTSGIDVESAQTDTAHVDTAPSGGNDRPPVDTNSVGVVDTTEWMTDAVDVDRAVPAIGMVDELRSGAHDQYDRLVVEFGGSVVPGYHVSYIEEQPIECGSGHPVDVVGNAVLQIRLQPARGHDDQGHSTVDHGERSYDLPVLREAEITCDFEAVFTIILGLKQRRPFRITELENPPRFVLDVRKTTNE